MWIRSVSLFVLLSTLVAVGATGCEGEPECASVYIPPMITGSFEASSVPFSEARDLHVCLNDRCDSTVSERVSIRIERTPAENPPFGSSSTAPPKPHKVFVSYSTQAPSIFELRTGDVLRLRFPNQPAGPWTTDVSLEATVNPGDRCTPTTGTFAPQ